MTLPLPLLHSVQTGADSAPGMPVRTSTVPTHVIMSSIEQAHQLASEQLTGRGFIQYWPALAELCGGIKPALMLGHAMYWTRGWLKKHPERGGWFWKTAKDWQEATGLTQREQESARNTLRELGIWQEELATTPGAGNRLFYRLNIPSLCDKLISAAKTKTEGTSSRWDDTFLLTLLGQPIAYYRALADLSGGVIGGLVLSHLLSELRAAVMVKSIDADGFFPYSVEQQRVTLALGTKSQRNAREALKKAGFVQEALTKGQRPTLLVAVNLAAILALLTGKGAPGANTPAGRIARKAQAQDRAQILSQDGNVTTLRGPIMVIDQALPQGATFVAPPSAQTPPDGGAFRHSRAALLSKRPGVNSNEGCPFVDSRAALLSALYTKPTLQRNSSSARERLSKHRVINPDDGRWRSLPLPFDEPVPATISKAPVSQLEEAIQSDVSQEHDNKPDVQKVSASVLDDLVWPEGIDVASARRVFANAPAHVNVQELIDELAGQMSAKTVPSPVGYLSTLLRKAKDGSFVPTRAVSVAEARAAKARYEVTLANAMASPVVEFTPASGGTSDEVERNAGNNVDGIERVKALRQNLAKQIASNLLSLTSGGSDAESSS